MLQTAEQAEPSLMRQEKKEREQRDKKKLLLLPSSGTHADAFLLPGQPPPTTGITNRRALCFSASFPLDFLLRQEAAFSFLAEDRETESHWLIFLLPG